MSYAMYKVGVLTVSDKGHRGEREDKGGEALKKLMGESGFLIERYEIVPDEIAEIKKTLEQWCDKDQLNLIVTTGGTGFSPRDVTPEATRQVIEREVPGLSEAMRMEGLKNTPRAMLSRGISGIRGRALIINLPGSVKGIKESLDAVMPALPHGLEVLCGQAGDCGVD